MAVRPQREGGAATDVVALDLAERIAHAQAFSRPYRITDGASFRRRSIDPADTGPLEAEHEPAAHAGLKEGVRTLAALQDRLYAQDRWSVVLVFQAMDAAGKDGTIKHVMSGVNPQGCQVFSFEAPSAEELDHDFMWRCLKRLPERGRIGIFNRSYDEEVLVVKVHAALLANQKLPPHLVTKSIWQERYEDIVATERYLACNGTLILKFFLHLCAKEQKQRLLARLQDPDKSWKFSTADAAERRHWRAYQRAYAAMIRATATEHAPWYVVPADHKWFTRLVVVAAVIDAMGSLGLHYPTVDEAKRADLDAARAALLAE